MGKQYEGFVGKTTVSPQNRMSVLAAFRENQCIEPGEELGWYRRETRGGVWEIGLPDGRGDLEGKTIVSPQNTTAVFVDFREDLGVGPGDELGWHHRETDAGDAWELRPFEGGDA